MYFFYDFLYIEKFVFRDGKGRDIHDQCLFQTPSSGVVNTIFGMQKMNYGVFTRLIT